MRCGSDPTNPANPAATGFKFLLMQTTTPTPSATLRDQLAQKILAQSEHCMDDNDSVFIVTARDGIVGSAVVGPG